VDSKLTKRSLKVLMIVFFGYRPTMQEKMEPSDLRLRMGIRYADLDPILEELSKEGRIQNRWQNRFIDPQRLQDATS
jgi:hypothetical protein